MSLLLLLLMASLLTPAPDRSAFICDATLIANACVYPSEFERCLRDRPKSDWFACDPRFIPANQLLITKTQEG
jgi:hypothetical protein